MSKKNESKNEEQFTEVDVRLQTSLDDLNTFRNHLEGTRKHLDSYFKEIEERVKKNGSELVTVRDIARLGLLMQIHYNYTGMLGIQMKLVTLDVMMVNLIHHYTKDLVLQIPKNIAKELKQWTAERESAKRAMREYLK